MIRDMRTSYVVALLVVWCLNGIALLQHLSITPSVDGYVAAVLLINMLAAPLVIWIAFIYGELAEKKILGRRHARTASTKHDA